MATFDWDSDFRRMQANDELTIYDLALQQIRLQSAALEQMAERMLVSPERCGIVVVIENVFDLDNLRAAGYRHYRLDPNVPFGHVYEFPSMEAYQVWIENGSPRF